MFGWKDDNGGYHPFHVYSMRQAIEEGFILDVLKNYMTYKMYYKIVKSIPDNPEIDTTTGVKAVLDYENCIRIISLKRLPLCWSSFIVLPEQRLAVKQRQWW